MPQRLQRVVGNIGAGQLLWRAAENPHHIHGHIADADDRRRLHRQIELAVAKVGMAVIPGDKVGSGVAAFQLFAGDIQVAVGLRAGREDDLVIVAAQIVYCHIGADLDVTKESKLGPLGHAIKELGDRLDLLMVGGDAIAYQPKRRGQALIHVDLHMITPILKELFGTVKAGWSGADNGDTQRVFFRAWLGHG